MRQDLEGRACCVRDAGCAELRADVVGARRRRIASQRGLGEVTTLLGLILDESGRVEVGLRYCNVEDASAR